MTLRLYRYGCHGQADSRQVRVSPELRSACLAARRGIRASILSRPGYSGCTARPPMYPTVRASERNTVPPLSHTRPGPGSRPQRRCRKVRRDGRYGQGGLPSQLASHSRGVQPAAGCRRRSESRLDSRSARLLPARMLTQQWQTWSLSGLLNRSRRAWAIAAAAAAAVQLGLNQVRPRSVASERAALACKH